jgi:quercetin dioxygenase-like cupin family protein
MNQLSHFRKTPVVRLLIAPAVIALATFTAVPARATPGCGFTSRNLLSPVPAGNFPSGLLNLMCRSNLPDWLLMTRIRGDSDLYITENTIQPGGQSGWHTHPGPSLITVTEGTVTVYESDCVATTYSVGESFTDIGCGDIHNIVNETATEAKTIAVQIVPHGATRRIDQPNPGCTQPAPCP